MLNTPTMTTPQFKNEKMRKTVRGESRKSCKNSVISAFVIVAMAAEFSTYFSADRACFGGNSCLMNANTMIPTATAFVNSRVAKSSAIRSTPSAAFFIQKTGGDKKITPLPSKKSSQPLSMSSFYPRASGTRVRKEKRVRQWGSSLLSTSTSRFKLMKLSATDNSNDDDKDAEKNNENEDSSSFRSVKNLMEKIDTIRKQAIEKKIPRTSMSISSLLEVITTWLYSIRKTVSVGLVSFIAGIVLTISAIFVPVYSSVEQLAEPVTLFETILSDLEQGYVDKVDTNKLFETGISAMLSSLDPYTEFESRQDAESLTESIEGKYGGVGLVIAGRTTDSIQKEAKLAPKSSGAATTSPNQEKPEAMKDGDISSSINENDKNDDGITYSSFDENYVKEEEEDDFDEFLNYQKRLSDAQKQRGIQVVNAFEGYAYDYGLRVGDKLLAVDDLKINEDTTVEDVRNNLRGVPGSEVTIEFEREGINGVQKVTMPRAVVRLRDVKLATLLGSPQQIKDGNGLGYIQLTGFAADAGREVRNAILSLQAAALDATDGEVPLQGLILDMRGNPGGLLTSAVDVASLLVPKGSEIVSAKGRGFPGVSYRSRSEPIIDTSTTKLAVLINGGTASAAEIVSGAVQDLDVGIIVGQDRTFGKGLVQNVETLPFDTALKFTIAKYYTPSGRCIQGINYSEGGGLNSARSEEGSRYIANKIEEGDRNTFYTRLGRKVQDGGGIEADYKVSAPKASALEVTLLRSGLLSDFAAKWSRDHEITSNFQVDDAMYKEFQDFVTEKQKKGEIKLETLYGKPLQDLQKVLKQSGYKSSESELARLRATIVREVMKDFEKYKSDIQEDISQSILARYLPESKLIERGVKNDKQVSAAAKLLLNRNKFDKLLANGSTISPSMTSNNGVRNQVASLNSDKKTNVATMSEEYDAEVGATINVRW